MMAYPAAKSYAIKDATECIGELFGRGLNRADQINYDTITHQFDKAKDILDAQVMVNGMDDIDDLLEWGMDQTHLHNNPRFDEMVQERKKQLEKLITNTDSDDNKKG